MRAKNINSLVTLGDSLARSPLPDNRATNGFNVVLISIGNCPSLALRNLRQFALSDPQVAASCHITLLDLRLQKFERAKEQSTQQWSFSTAFDETLAQLAGLKPQLIGFSCYLWNTTLSLQLADLVKKILPATEIILGGPDAGPRAKELISSHRSIDAVIDGDGEHSLRRLLQLRLGAVQGFHEVPSAVFRDGDEIFCNPAGAEVDMTMLNSVWGSSSNDTLPDLSGWRWPHVLVETLRGCPYQCSYCMYGKTPLNEKPVDQAVDELLVLLQRGLLVEIVDPTFTTYKKRAKKILRRLTEHDYPGRITVEVYPDSLDEEMADLLLAAGTSSVGMGFQTLSTAGLKAVRRPKNLQRFETAVRLLQERKLPFYVDLIYGLPATTPADFRASVDYLYSLDVYALMIYRLLGLPGSPMMDSAEAHGLIFSDQPPYELLASPDFCLEDIMACERLRLDLDQWPGKLGTQRFRSAAARLGSVCELVARLNATELPEQVLSSLEDPDSVPEAVGSLSPQQAMPTEARQ